MFAFFDGMDKVCQFNHGMDYISFTCLDGQPICGSLYGNDIFHMLLLVLLDNLTVGSLSCSLNCLILDPTLWSLKGIWILLGLPS